MIGLAMVSIYCSRSSTPPNPVFEVWLLPNPLSPSAKREPVRFETGGRGHVQFVPSKGPPLGITTDGVVVLGNAWGEARPVASRKRKRSACRGGAGTGGSSSSTTAATCRSSNEWDRPRTSSLGRRAACSATVRLPDRRRTEGAGMGRHARWAALPGHEPATRRASVDCDRHQLGRGVIEGLDAVPPSRSPCRSSDGFHSRCRACISVMPAIYEMASTFRTIVPTKTPMRTLTRVPHRNLVYRIAPHWRRARNSSSWETFGSVNVSGTRTTFCQLSHFDATLKAIQPPMIVAASST